MKSSALWYQYRAYKHLLKIEALAQHIHQICVEFIEKPENPHKLCYDILTHNYLILKKQKEELLKQWESLHPRELITALIKSVEESLLQELRHIPRPSHFSAFRQEMSRVRSLIHNIRIELNQIKLIIETPPKQDCNINLEEHWHYFENGEETILTFAENLETVLHHVIHQARLDLKRDEILTGQLDVQSPPIYLHQEHSKAQERLIQILEKNYLNSLLINTAPNPAIVKKMARVEHLTHEAIALKRILEDAFYNKEQHKALQTLFNVANALHEEAIEVQQNSNENESFLREIFQDLLKKSESLGDIILTIQPTQEESLENSYHYFAAYEAHVSALNHFIKDFPYHLRNIRKIHVYRSHVTELLSKMDIESFSTDEKYTLLYGLKKLISSNCMLEPFLEIILKKTQALEDSKNVLMMYLSSQKFSYIQKDCSPDQSLISRCEACFFGWRNMRQHLNLLVDHFPEDKSSLRSLLSSTLENIRRQVEGFSLFLLRFYLHTTKILLSVSVFRQMVIDIHFFSYARQELKEKLEIKLKGDTEQHLLANTLQGVEQLLSWFPEETPKTNYFLFIPTSWGHLIQKAHRAVIP